MTLDLTGVVYVTLPEHDEPYPMRFVELDPFTQGWVARTLWSLDKAYSDLTPGWLALAIDVCRDIQAGRR